MSPPDSDTITAVATPPGRGGVGIIRLSGPCAAAIAEAVVGTQPPPRHAGYRSFRDPDGAAIDHGLVLHFPAPHSFTGEEVVELQGHGGPVVLDRLLRRLTDLGARLAEPGEFSRRAFLNDRIDLTQAEAIADLIDSATEEAARAAMRSLEGVFSQRVEALAADLTDLRVYVEAALDFVDEEIDFLSEGEVERRLAAIEGRLAELFAGATQGRLLRDGMTLVLAGRPNAGKSSLLNRLAEHEAAIVTAIPGTTRDLLREEIQLDGMPLHVIDTAGLRESNDEVEMEGIRRAWGAIERADRVLLVVEDKTGIAAEERAIIERLPHRLPVTVARNKIDLSGAEAKVCDGPLGPEIAISARTGAGMELLRRHLEQAMGYQGESGGGFIARRRHLDALGEITGRISADELLGRIFNSFCIGK